MRPSKLIVIVPRLPPSVDGLGDYGLLLAQQMRLDQGVETTFIVGDPYWGGNSVINSLPIHQIKNQSPSALYDLLNELVTKEHTILLHYVGYGYAKKGCPFWLVKGLDRWVGKHGTKMVTMFHELYAFGPIWSRQFWTSPMQRYIARELVQLSDRCVTSKEKYAQIISNFSRERELQVEIMPVFSNVGEPVNSPPLLERKKRLVIFGGRGPRERVYKFSLEGLKRTCQDLEIEEIYDIGSEVNFELPRINGIEINKCGVLAPDKISDILIDSRVGFFSYPTEYLLKSGIFAAYCAHGVVPVGTWYDDQMVDQVEANKHYWLADKFSGKMNLVLAQVIAENAYNWYQQHNLKTQAKMFSEII